MSDSKLNERFFMDTVHADVVFVVENEEILGHRAAFAISCTYFDRLLYGDFKESKSRKVAITGTSAKVFKVVKRFIYLGKLEVEDWKIDDLLGLLSLAHQYQYQELFAAVMNALRNYPKDFHSWTLIYSAAATYDSDSLKAKCVTFAEAQVDNFLRLKNMEKMTEEFICVMFETPKIRTVNQGQLLSSLLQWKKTHQSAQITSVLQKISWHQVSHNTLAIFTKLFIGHLKNEEENPICNQLVHEIQVQSNFIAKVENVSLSRDKPLEFALDKHDCSIICAIYFGFIELSFKKNDSFKEISVNRMEFELPRDNRIQEVLGRGMDQLFKRMDCNIVAKSIWWLKYSATYSNGRKTCVLRIYSDKFNEVPKITLRNLVIN